MNIFYTSTCPVESANNLCTIHINKMYQECCQLLSTALQLNGVDDKALPRITHQNHPSAVWTRSSKHHYNWVLKHALSLRALYGKSHGYDKYLDTIMSHTPVLSSISFVDPPKCVDDELRKACIFKSVTEVYQLYLRNKYVDWTTRTDKRKMVVKFVGEVPTYLDDLTF